MLLKSFRVNYMFGLLSEEKINRVKLKKKAKEIGIFNCLTIITLKGSCAK